MGSFRFQEAEPFPEACCRVCGAVFCFMGKWNVNCVSPQDAALLSAVLSANMISSLLAMDAWCFLARYVYCFVFGWFIVVTNSELF